MSLDVSLTRPACDVCRRGADTVYSDNITHNLNAMAEEAGMYMPLWRPEEVGIASARALIEPLRAGLDRLRAEPDRFKALNPANGWGSYDILVAFVAAYLKACEENPSAGVEVSR